MPTDPTGPAADVADLGALTELVGYHLRRASAAFAGDFARALAGTGMRQVPFGILAVVGANPGINQGTIGRNLGIQRANMVALITELVDGGLIERRASAEDRRAFALSLSDAGERMLHDCLARIERHEREMLADMSEAERTGLIALLQRIAARER